MILINPYWDLAILIVVIAILSVLFARNFIKREGEPNINLEDSVLSNKLESLKKWWIGKKVISMIKWISVRFS